MKRKTDERKKKAARKAKKIRSIVMMALLCILLLSTATYAWFTLSNTAKVANLTMTVGEVNGLRVALPSSNGGAPSDESKWSGKVELPEIKGELMPANSRDGKTFSKPVYNEEGQVEKLEAVKDTEKLTKSNSDSKKQGYYYETTFYIQSLGEDAKVKLVQGENLGNESTRKGTYVRVKEYTNKSKGSKNAAAAIRVSLTANGQTKVYEPCADITDKSGTRAELAKGVSFSAVSTDAAQNENGKFNPGGQYSNIVLNLKEDEKTLVTLRIWVEGTDDQCVNEIQLEKLVGQLQFVKDND